MTDRGSNHARRLLVAGSSGFVGGAIARAAQADGYDVAGIARSGAGPVPCLANTFEVAPLTQALRSFKPDVLVHAVGLPSVAATEADPKTAHTSNVEPFRILVEAIEAANLTCTVIFVSSAAVYGNPVHLPVREDASLTPISAYGRQRIECEEMAADLARRRGLTAYAIRTFSLFGAGQRRLLVWELFNRVSRDDVVTIAGTGKEMRDFLDVDTFSRGVLRLAERPIGGFSAVNVASGVGTTVRSIAELMLDVTGVDKPIICQGRVFPNDPLRWQADVKRFRALTKTDSEYDLRRSIKTVVEAWR